MTSPQSNPLILSLLEKVVDTQDQLLSRMDDVMDILSEMAVVRSAFPTTSCPTSLAISSLRGRGMHYSSMASSQQQAHPRSPPCSPSQAAKNVDAAAVLPNPTVPTPPAPLVPADAVEDSLEESEPLPKPGFWEGLHNRVLYADSVGRGILHTLLSIFACLEYVTVTSSIVYCHKDSAGYTAYMYLLFVGMTLMLCMEMLFNFNTAYHRNHWEIVDNVKNSRRQYFRHWFWWDFIMTIPWDLFALAIQGLPLVSSMCVSTLPTAFSVLNLLRILHVIRIPTYFRRRNPILDSPRWVNVLYILAISTILLHTLSIIWISVASEEEQKVSEEDSFAYQYMMAFNWGFQNFVHGKSDVYGHSSATVMYGLVVKILGFLVIVTMEAKLAELFVNHDPFHGLARQRQQQLASLINHNHVPWDVQKCIMSIYPTLLQLNMRDYYNIMNDLPPFLSEQITKYIKMKLVSHVPMFAQTSEACRAALATCLVEEMLGPGLDIVTRGEEATSMYFLMHGMVEVLILDSEGREVSLTTLKEGSWFGEIALIQNTTRTASVRTATAVKVFRLEKSDFNDLAQKFPELRRRIQEVAAARLKVLQTKDDRVIKVEESPEPVPVPDVAHPPMVPAPTSEMDLISSKKSYRLVSSPTRARLNIHRMQSTYMRSSTMSPGGGGGGMPRVRAAVKPTVSSVDDEEAASATMSLKNLSSRLLAPQELQDPLHLPGVVTLPLATATAGPASTSSTSYTSSNSASTPTAALGLSGSFSPHSQQQQHQLQQSLRDARVVRIAASVPPPLPPPLPTPPQQQQPQPQQFFPAGQQHGGAERRAWY